MAVELQKSVFVRILEELQEIKTTVQWVVKFLIVKQNETTRGLKDQDIRVFGPTESQSDASSQQGQSSPAATSPPI